MNTLFHEFGHTLHGMLSRARYPTLSGTNVPRDFVEFPSQFNEHWALEPVVLARYAKHHKTGQPMPQQLVEKIKKARTFNQGFATTEYLAAALLDLDWHSLPAGTAQRMSRVRASVLRERIDLPESRLDMLPVLPHTLGLRLLGRDIRLSRSDVMNHMHRRVTRPAA